jgi:hypothetical protein
VKHLPERGGRLRTVRQGQSEDPLPGSECRRHALPRARLRPTLPLDVAVARGPGAPARAPLRGDVPAGVLRSRRARPARRRLPGARFAGGLGGAEAAPRRALTGRTSGQLSEQGQTSRGQLGRPTEIVPRDDAGSARRPMYPGRPRHSVRAMAIKLWILALAALLVTLALCSWAVQGVRWALTGGRSSSRRRAIAREAWRPQHRPATRTA